MQRINRRHGEVATFNLGAVTDVAVVVGVAGGPGRFFRIDGVTRTTHIRVPLHVIEDKEFGLGAKEGGVTNTRRGEIFLSTLGHAARITLIALHGGRLNDVAAQDHGGIVGKRVEY